MVSRRAVRRKLEELDVGERESAEGIMERWREADYDERQEMLDAHMDGELFDSGGSWFVGWIWQASAEEWQRERMLGQSRGG